MENHNRDGYKVIGKVPFNRSIQLDGLNPNMRQLMEKGWLFCLNGAKERFMDDCVPSTKDAPQITMRKWNGKHSVPYSKRKRYKTKTELTREGCARASWKMLKWFLPVGTRAIANEIENYLCDLGPGINLFFSFDGFPFVLFSLLFFRWLFTFVTIIKPILFLFKFQFFFSSLLLL